MRWVVPCFLLAAASVEAQSVSGSIAGVVTDPRGAVVPGAHVSARNIATNSQTTQTTGEDGFYRLANLVPGEYAVEVESPGFRKAMASSGELNAAGAVRLDVKLELGQVTESVTVQAAATEIDTEDAQTGTTIRNISDLPILSGNSGRNVLSLIGTQPGVVPSAPGGSGISAAGQRTGSNNFILDGADSNEPLLASSDAVQTISPDAVAEFRLITGAMKAEYGRNSGAVVVVTTKSGGNALHGAASETLRNPKLNAAPFFLNSIPGGARDRLPDGTLRRPQWNGNDFDVNAGGPVRRDKTFFFVSYLGFRRRQGQAVSATVPTDAQRDAIEAQGRPEAKALLALIPRASSGDLLLSAPSDTLDRNQGLAKVDHYFSRDNRLSATYFFDEQANISPFPGTGATGTTIPGFGTVNGTRWQNIVVHDTQTFSARWFQEFRVSFHRRGDLLILPLNHTSLASLGLGNIVPDNPALEGPPRVLITGFTAFGNSGNPRSFKRNDYQFLDNISYARGRHDWKFGGEFRKYFPNLVSNNNNTGQITVDGSGTTNGSPLVPHLISGLSAPLNDFANGFASSFLQQSTHRQKERTSSIDLFLQDDWKPLTNLTLNMGLRWEYNSNPIDTRDQVITLRPGQQSTVFPDAPRGIVYPGDAGVPRSTYRGDWNNFGPRFGLAWDPLKNGRLSLRGGYALLYDADTLPTGFFSGLPFQITATVPNTSYANPWQGSLTEPIAQPFPFQTAHPGARFDYARFGTMTFGVVDRKFATPYAQQWSLQLQTIVGKDWLVEAGYARSAGAKLIEFREINPAVSGPGATIANTDQRRVLNQNNSLDAAFGGAVFGSIVAAITDANSSYDSLRVNVSHHFAGGLYMSHAYTWSHAIDDSSGTPGDVPTFTATSRNSNLRADRGNAGFDVRQRYTATYVYELPFLKSSRGAGGLLLGGWTVSGITTFQTGLPFDITEPNDRCLCSSGGQRPDYIGGVVQFFDPRSTASMPGKPNAWFDGSHFQRVGSGNSYALGAGRFGNLGRNVFHAPGINNWDFSLMKRVTLAESRRLEFRGELLNLFNHAEFSAPVSSIANSDFGRITATRDPRIIQVSVRLGF